MNAPPPLFMLTTLIASLPPEEQVHAWWRVVVWAKAARMDPTDPHSYGWNDMVAPAYGAWHGSLAASPGDVAERMGRALRLAEPFTWKQSW